MMNKEYPRRQAQAVKRALETRRVVILSGARQTGKTTLTGQVKDGDCELRTLDDTTLLDLALSDPRGFVKTTAKTLIIDEIQKAPKLIPEIKMIVDKDNRNGQFLLTGSVHLQTMPAVTESLAGRVKNIRLRPLTVGEILRKQTGFLARAFDKDFPSFIGGYDKRAIVELAFRGGYPEAVRIKNVGDRREWHKDYVQTLIDYDVADIANIRRRDVMGDLMSVLLAWSAKFMDMSAIGTSLALNKITLDSYVNWLLALYIFDKVPPWLKTDYERVSRKAKLYAADTGLMTSVLGWNFDAVMLDADRSGKLVETFVFQELAAQVDAGYNYTLFHYRDRTDREIDFLIERDDGALLGVEVKAGHTVTPDDFAPQRWFCKNIVNNRNPYVGLVLYSGDRVIRFDDTLLAVPIAALWMS